MLPQFSRAGNFEPKLYTGGGMRFYLPLLHDIVASEKPALIVTPWPGGAQAHLLFARRGAQNIHRCARSGGQRWMRTRQNHICTDVDGRRNYPRKFQRVDFYIASA